MWQHLRIATAYVCLVLCLGFVATWVQSYQSLGVLNEKATDTYEIAFLSWRGQVLLGLFRLSDSSSGFDRGLAFLPSDTVGDKKKKDLEEMRGTFGFYFERQIYWWIFAVPHWFLALVAGGLALLLKPKPITYTHPD